jgi:hypothetical protein
MEVSQFNRLTYKWNTNSNHLFFGVIFGVGRPDCQMVSHLQGQGLPDR